MSEHFIPTSVIALFCEDVREEKSGGFTLLGILPDNAYVQPLPADAPPNSFPGMAKLCIYVRLHYDTRKSLGEIKSKLILPDGNENSLAIFDTPTVEKGRQEALKSGAPIVGVFSRVEIAPLIITNLGRMRVEVTIGDQMFVAGNLNFTDKPLIS